MTVLDPSTLGAAFVLLSAVLGGMLLFSWMLNRKVQALAWWGSAFCLIPIGIAMGNLGRGVPASWTILIANGLVLLAYGMLYSGCRAFNNRPVFLPGTAAGLAIWVAAFPFIHDWYGTRLLLASATTGVYAALSAWELWRHAPQWLASQRVAIVLMVGLAAFNLFRGFLGISSSTIPWIDSFAARWSVEMALFLVVYGPALAFIFLSMAKEQVEYHYKQAALTDPLTGIPNRRAFLENGSRLLGSAGARQASCLLFDLDNFKGVNDGFGHDAGDRVLCVFGDILSHHLPPGSYGRLGGEEFGAILAASESEAAELADRIRRAFAAIGNTLLGPGGVATVSVGCATAVHGTAHDLLTRADAALYRAKTAGRNTVVTARSNGDGVVTRFRRLGG